MLPRRARARAADLVLLTASVAALAVVGATAVSADGSTAYTPPQNAPAGPPSEAYGTTSAANAHEVWLVDQSDTAAGHGGRIEVHDGAALRSGRTSAPEVVDLAGATTALCEQSTGARPTRPHMIVFSPDQTHAVLAFVVSGHTVFFDAATRTPVACFRSDVGAGGARQAHAAVVTPDGRYVLVANQNGKRLERIRTDWATGTFTAEPEAALDLASGTTPNGVARQTPQDPSVRPDNAPICPFVPSTGYPALVSLRGGGAFAVDPYATPMALVAEYTSRDVPRDGCGFTEAAGWVYGNGGLPAPAVGQTTGWAVHRFPLGGRDVWTPENPPGVPVAQVVQRDARTGRDAHGMTTVGGDVWAFDRLGHALQLYRGSDSASLAEVDLRGPWGGQPAPDIAAPSPDGRSVYVATRGPAPLSGAHAARGDAPGLLAIEVGTDGAPPVVRRHVAATRGNASDPHGLAVRRTGTPRTAQPTAEGRGTDRACPAGTVPADRFPDVPAGSVHASAVDCLAAREVVRGFADGTYRPTAPVTRAQLATFVAETVREAGGPLPDAPRNAFADDDASPHAAAVDRLAAVGIVLGTQDGRFRPDALVTRAQLSSFLVRAYAHVTGDALPLGGPSFTDTADVAQRADVERAAGAGLTGGRADGRFDPFAPTGRGQMATFLARLLDVLLEDGTAVRPAA